MMELCAIVIPIYKDRLSSFEEKSLKQCVKILSKYQFIFVSPHGLDMLQFCIKQFFSSLYIYKEQKSIGE